jgi:co-chaperonin GroES (HSP10)
MNIDEIQGAIEPRNQQIVVIQDVQDDVTSAGVYISEGARSKYQTGTIAAAAPDCNEAFVPGVRIGIRRFAGTPATLIGADGQSAPVLMLHEKDITAIMSAGAKLASEGK